MIYTDLKFSPEINSGEIINFLNNKAEKYVERASQMASEILANYQGTVYEGPVIIREYHYYDDSFLFDPWFSRRPRVIVVGNEPAAKPTIAERKAVKDKNDAGVAMIAGFVAAGAFYYMLSSINLHEDAQTELRETKEFKKQVVENMPYSQLDNCEYLIQTLKVADVKEKMCQRIKSSSAWDVALRATLLATSSFVVGSYFLNRSLMPIGICGSVVSGFGMMLKACLDDTENRNTLDARNLQNLIADLPNRAATAETSENVA